MLSGMTARPAPPARVAPDTTPERLLLDLNEAQREAVRAPGTPLAILAGAGSGKTRVISRRAAYAIETGSVPASQILLVTFTDKAAREMAERMAALGHRGVMARTFHAAALAQLRHFWPAGHAGAPLPRIVESKLGILVPIARRLPGHYRFTPAKDLADTIEWAKVRRIRPGRWLADGSDRATIPADLFARVYGDYERSKTRAGLIDFEDILVETVELLETDAAAAELVRSRKRWLSVDEYQDTNPLAERLLTLWLGESPALTVVGDPEQTIYTFTGATPDFLLRFGERHPGARTLPLLENYRSSPEILALANRLGGTSGRGPLRATRPSGPAPAIKRATDEEAELRELVAAIRARLAEGTQAGEIAVLVRLNAQLPPIEEALTRAGIAYRIRGQRFFDRPEIRQARAALRRARLSTAGFALVGDLRGLLGERLGLEPDAAGDAGPGSGGGIGDGSGGGPDPGAEARERAASLELLLEIAQDVATRDPSVDLAGILAELDRRDADEAAGTVDGVNLLTYHRAKGLEWDAVFLPALEEGSLPVRQAKDDDAVAEERRLLYVGITRARRYLALSWAQQRSGSSGSATRRQPSRFLAELQPRAATRSSGPRVIQLPPAWVAAGGDSAGAADEALFEALRQWRRDRAREDEVPAYVVAPDATLHAIAEVRPRSPSALRRVPGIGPAKLERYGAEILAIVGRATPS